MIVSDLIARLSEFDPNKRVMIQQGEEYDYMEAYSVKEQELVDANSIDDEVVEVVTILYQ